MLRAVVSISRGLNRWVQSLVAVMGMAMAAIVGVQVFFRYGLNHSLFWSEELARVLLVWLTFFGASVAYYHRAHPGVDGLVRRLGPGLQRAAALLSHLAALTLFTIMIIHGAQFAWFVRLQITPALGWPKWVIMGAVPAAGIIFWIHGLALVIKSLNGEAHDN